MIITLSGVYAIGKTTIARELLKRLLNSQMIVSYTTRQPRDTDLLGEYSYISQEKFDELFGQDFFIWSQLQQGNSYGTAFEDLDKTRNQPDKVFFMILTPQVIAKLCRYARDKKIRVISFYIYISSAGREDILRKRLLERGESFEKVEKRILDCKGWDEQFRRSNLFEFFVANDGDIKDSVAAIEKVIKIS